MLATHLAAVSPGKGQPFEVQTRITPKPGPDELLIAVKSVALNPADAYMRDQGLFIPAYPTVIGFDVAGLVLEAGCNVPTTAGGGGGGGGASGDSPGLFFRAGITRVAAFAASFWRSCDADYGAFQERCLVPWQHAVPLPDKGLSWNEAATLPVAVEVPLNAWDIMGIPRVGEEGEEQVKRNTKKREALLIWGASSSIGTMGVQTARLLRDDDDANSCIAAVYATAGSANREYVTSLGADRVFDHRDPHVVEAIVSAAKHHYDDEDDDGLVIRHCFLATGQLAPCQAVLAAFLGEGRDQGGEKGETAKIASAPMIPPDAEVVDGVETVFVLPSVVEGERLGQFQYWIGTWLRENLAKGTVRPSPEPKVVGKGLGAIDAGLDMLLRGVSCTKLVVEIAE